MKEKWYSLEYETIFWTSNVDMSYLSRQSKRKILDTYESSIPDTIADKSLTLPSQLEARVSDLLINMSRFDMAQSQKGYSFPTLLLRSESAASSQIENLTSGIRNISLAELTDKVPKNAQLIAGNVHAMREALNIEEPISYSTILEIHRMLMIDVYGELAGTIRQQTVWIGGTSLSPHGATFVPPHFSRIDDYLQDLIKYAGRIDINPLVKAAILHAQFEIIHPFSDGNGRTGRVLIHKSLRDDGVLKTVALPISAGLLNNTSDYMKALMEFQKGDPIPIIEQLIGAIETSLLIGDIVSDEISVIQYKWLSRINERKSSSIYRLVNILLEQPVINSNYLSHKLDITPRAANQLIERAIGYGILSRFGSEKRGIFYQSNDIIEIMNRVSSNEIIKRNL